MKKAGLIIGVAIIVLVILSGMKNMIAKIAIEKASKAIVGLKLDIGSLNIGIIKTLTEVKDLRLYNPEGFEDKVMFDIPEIYVDYNLPEIFKGKIHLYDMKLDLKECVIAKNKDGKLNLDSLKAVQGSSARKRPNRESKEVAPDFQIDQLELKIGRVVFKDYSKGVTPYVLRFNVNLDEKYKNITDPNALVSLIVVKVVMNTGIGKLIKLDIAGLQDTIGNTLSSVQHIAGKTTSKVVDSAGKTLSNTAGKVTDKLKLSFGGK